MFRRSLEKIQQSNSLSISEYINFIEHKSILVNSVIYFIFYFQDYYYYLFFFFFCKQNTIVNWWKRNSTKVKQTPESTTEWLNMLEMPRWSVIFSL